jgi:cytochrome b561
VEAYDRVARAVHWLVAALAVIVTALGWAIAGAPRNTATRDLLLLLHRSVGLTILAAMLFRVGWRWRRPPPPTSIARFERAVAGGTHFSLYLIFVVMPLAGYVNAAAAGHAVSLFGVVSIPPLLPKTAGCRRWQRRFTWSGSTSSISLSPSMLPARCSTASFGATGCSTVCCRAPDPADRTRLLRKRTA